MELARPERFELPTTKFVAWYSIQLSYGRIKQAIMRDACEPVNATQLALAHGLGTWMCRPQRAPASEGQARSGFARLACAMVGQDATHRDVGSAAKASGAPAAPIRRKKKRALMPLS